MVAPLQEPRQCWIYGELARVALSSNHPSVGTLTSQDIYPYPAHRSRDLAGCPYFRPDGGVNGAKVRLPIEPIPPAAQVLRPG